MTWKLERLGFGSRRRRKEVGSVVKEGVLTPRLAKRHRGSRGGEGFAKRVLRLLRQLVQSGTDLRKGRSLILVIDKSFSKTRGGLGTEDLLHPSLP